MRRLPVLSFAFVFTGLLTASGCTVGSPSTAFAHPAGSDDMAGSTGTQVGTNNSTQDMAAPLTPPQLATYSQTSVWTTVPLHGTASPPNSSVIITSMDGTHTSADVDGSGRFCADLALVANTTNSFQLKTHDNDTGEESESISIRVTQSGEPPQGAQTQGAMNAAIGGAATSYQIGNNGTAPAQPVTDGDPSTRIEASYDPAWWSSPAPAVTVQLSATSSINQIVAILPSDCVPTATLVLAYSADSTPSTPGPGAQGWVTTNATLGSDGLTWTASFTPATASYIALWWTSTSEYSDGCGWFEDGFGVAELQGWTAAGVQQPPQSAPTCGL